MTSVQPRRKLDAGRYQRMRQAGFSDEEIQADGFDLPDAPEIAKSADPRTEWGFGRSMAQGATFGFGDEIEAGVKSMLPGRTYNEEIKDVRAGKKKYETEHPGRAIAAELLGGVATSVVPVAGVARAAQGASKAVQVGRALATGAASGALSGFGAAEGSFTERLPQAGMGGVLGGVVGPAVGAGVGKLAARAGETSLGQAIAKVMTRGGKGAAGPAAENLSKAERQALKYADKSFRNDKGSLVDALTTAAPEGDLVYNRGGRNVSRATQVSQSIPSEATEFVPRALNAQLEAEPERLVGTLRRATGSKLENAKTRLKEFSDDAASTMKPVYDKLRNVIVDESDELTDVLGRPAVKTALQSAESNILNKGMSLPEAEAWRTVRSRLVDASGAPLDVAEKSSQRATTVGMLDDIKKVLDDEIESIEEAIESGMARGADKSRLQGLKSARAAVIDVADKASPEYAAAREQAAPLLDRRESFRAGTNFGPSTNRDQLRLDQAARSPESRSAFAEGAAHRIRDDIERTGDRRDAAKRFFGSNYEREKLGDVFAGNPAAGEIDEAFEQATRRHSQSRAANLEGKSATTPLREAIDDFRGGNLLDMALATYNLPRAAVKALATKVKEMSTVDAEGAAILGRIMVAQPGSAEAKQLAAQFEKLQLMRGRARAVGSALANTTTGQRIGAGQD